MQSIRQALLNHLETVRTFSFHVMGVDSGIYDIDQLGTLIREPNTLISLETDFISGLLEALQIIRHYITMVERWTDHIYGLERNLGIKEADGIRIQRQETTAVDLLNAKTFDIDYLRWILADTADELDRLAAATQALETKATRLTELAQKFGGPYLEKVHQITTAWFTGGRHEFHKHLVDLIETASGKKDTKGMVQHLGRYVDIMAMIVRASPLFVDTPTTILYTPSLGATRRELVSQLLQRTEELATFVRMRTQAYLLLVRHQAALLQAVLAPSVAVGDWLVGQFSDPTKSVDQLLPQTFATDTLPLAIEQAGELLNEWNTTIDHGLPLLQDALALNQTLGSPALAKFLAADERRLKLYREWHAKIAASFEALCRCTQPQI
jgi:hypothetical protein